MMTKRHELTDDDSWDRLIADGDAWSVIRQQLGQLSMPEHWLRTYHDKSMTFRDQKNRRDIKITLDGHVFHDEPRGKGEYRSEKFVHKTMGEAAAKVLELLGPRFVIS